MEQNNFDYIEIKELIANAKQIAILPSKIAGGDAFCAGVALYNMIKDMDKKVNLVFPGKFPDGCEDLITKDEVTPSILKSELLVSIDYSDTPAAKVQYSTDDNILFLNIAPINRDFDLKRVKAEVTGYNYDVIITIGAPVLDDYGQTYREMQNVFNSATIINLDNTDRNIRYGKYNIVDITQDSLSLLVLNYLPIIDFRVTKNTAKTLYRGITYRELNFH